MRQGIIDIDALEYQNINNKGKDDKKDNTEKQDDDGFFNFLFIFSIFQDLIKFKKEAYS